MRNYIRRVTITIEPEPDHDANLTEEQADAIYEAALKVWVEMPVRNFWIPGYEGYVAHSELSGWIDQDKEGEHVCEGCNKRATDEEFETGWHWDDEGVRLCPECLEGLEANPEEEE